MLCGLNKLIVCAFKRNVYKQITINKYKMQFSLQKGARSQYDNRLKVRDIKYFDGTVIDLNNYTVHHWRVNFNTTYLKTHLFLMPVMA